MPATVVGSGENRKTETQVLILMECPFQLMEGRGNKSSGDRQVGMRSFVLESQNHGESLVLISIFISSFQPKGYWQRVTTGVENVDDHEALPKRMSVGFARGQFTWLRGCWSYLVNFEEKLALHCPGCFKGWPVQTQHNGCLPSLQFRSGSRILWCYQLVRMYKIAYIPWDRYLGASLSCKRPKLKNK